MPVTMLALNIEEEVTSQGRSPSSEAGRTGEAFSHRGLRGPAVLPMSSLQPGEACDLQSYRTMPLCLLEATKFVVMGYRGPWKPIQCPGESSRDAGLSRTALTNGPGSSGVSETFRAAGPRWPGLPSPASARQRCSRRRSGRPPSEGRLPAVSPIYLKGRLCITSQRVHVITSTQ